VLLEFVPLQGSCHVMGIAYPPTEQPGDATALHWAGSDRLVPAGAAGAQATKHAPEHRSGGGERAGLPLPARVVADAAYRCHTG
jgi:hypothetical protein